MLFKSIINLSVLAAISATVIVGGFVIRSIVSTKDQREVEVEEEKEKEEFKVINSNINIQQQAQDENIIIQESEVSINVEELNQNSLIVQESQREEEEELKVINADINVQQQQQDEELNISNADIDEPQPQDEQDINKESGVGYIVQEELNTDINLQQQSQVEDNVQELNVSVNALDSDSFIAKQPQEDDIIPELEVEYIETIISEEAKSIKEVIPQEEDDELLERDSPVDINSVMDEQLEIIKPSDQELEIQDITSTKVNDDQDYIQQHQSKEENTCNSDNNKIESIGYDDQQQPQQPQLNEADKDIPLEVENKDDIYGQQQEERLAYSNVIYVRNKSPIHNFKHNGHVDKDRILNHFRKYCLFGSCHLMLNKDNTWYKLYSDVHRPGHEYFHLSVIYEHPLDATRAIKQATRMSVGNNYNLKLMVTPHKDYPMGFFIIDDKSSPKKPDEYPYTENPANNKFNIDYRNAHNFSKSGKQKDKKQIRII